MAPKPEWLEDSEPDPSTESAPEAPSDDDAVSELSNVANAAPTSTDPSTWSRSIPLLVPPSLSERDNGMPICVYIRSDDPEPRVWWAADSAEADEIRRFVAAAEAIDFDGPGPHVARF